jgi:hypothetical protein
MTLVAMQRRRRRRRQEPLKNRLKKERRNNELEGMLSRTKCFLQDVRDALDRGASLEYDVLTKWIRHLEQEDAKSWSNELEDVAVKLYHRAQQCDPTTADRLTLRFVVHDQDDWTSIKTRLLSCALDDQTGCPFEAVLSRLCTQKSSASVRKLVIARARPVQCRQQLFHRLDGAHSEVIDELVTALEPCGEKKSNPLGQRCVVRAFETRQFDLVRLLYRHGMCAPWPDMCASLSEAASLGDMDMLTHCFEPCDRNHSFYQTGDALTVAVAFGHEAIAKELVRRGFRLQTQLVSGPHALAYAAMLQESWALDLLLPLLTPELTKRLSNVRVGDTPLRAAAANRRYHHLPALGYALGRDNVLPALLLESHLRGLSHERSAGGFVRRWLSNHSDLCLDALELAHTHGCHHIMSEMLLMGIVPGPSPNRLDTHGTSFVGVVRLLMHQARFSALQPHLPEAVVWLVLQNKKIVWRKKLLSELLATWPS